MMFLISGSITNPRVALGFFVYEWFNCINNEFGLDKLEKQGISPSGGL